MRYSDSFSHVEDNLYYSRNLKTNIKVDTKYGDTYQSALYSPAIIEETLGVLHEDIVVVSISVEEVQTSRVFLTFSQFCDGTQPVVHLTLLGTTTDKFDESKLPYTTRLEVI